MTWAALAALNRDGGYGNTFCKWSRRTQAAKGTSAMPTNGEARPDPKPERAPRRYRRTVASARGWAALRVEKDGPCRICGSPPPNELHHLVSRSRGGDDVAANLVPLCVGCHDLTERRNSVALRSLLAAMADVERAYCVAKLGGNALERIFGEAVLA